YAGFYGLKSPQYEAIEKELRTLDGDVKELATRYGKLKKWLDDPQVADRFAKLAESVDLREPVREKVAEIAARAFRFYELYKPRLLDNEARRIWRDAITKLDAMRRLSGNYQKERLARLVKDVDDACRTLPPEIFDAVRMLVTVLDAGRE